MKKFLAMVALAAVSFSSVYAVNTPGKPGMAVDTVKKKMKVKSTKKKVKTKMKKDSTKTMPTKM